MTSPLVKYLSVEWFRSTEFSGCFLEDGLKSYDKIEKETAKFRILLANL